MSDTTKEERELLREFVRWLTDDSKRIWDWRLKAEKARNSKIEPGTQPLWFQEAEDKAATLTRQWLCSMADQFETARNKAGTSHEIAPLP